MPNRWPPSTPKKIGLKCRIPETLYNEVKVLLLDPVHFRVGYGDLSALATALFQRWVDEQRAAYTEEKKAND